MPFSLRFIFKELRLGKTGFDFLKDTPFAALHLPTRLGTPFVAMPLVRCGFVPSPALGLSSTRRTESSSTRALRLNPVRSPPRAALPMRVGHGFDLHRLEPGLPLVLGGVTLAHDRGCAGHSDGDAVYHCVVDAVLGALALPDIGQLFPDTDPRFKGAASHVFMSAAFERMAAAGYAIGNLDVTIILERPKLSPHKAFIRQNIADLLHTDLENVNVKAKTHEKVDAVGENRAVAVHAVVILVRDSESALATSLSTSKAEAMPRSTGATVTANLMRAVGDRAASILGSETSKFDASGANVSDANVTSISPALSSTPDTIQRLYDTILSRKGADPSSSWTAKLFSKGRAKIAQKVGEEAVEVVIDSTMGRTGDKGGVVKESADLIYHLSVLWADMDIRPTDVWAELEAREGTSGITEKSARASPTSHS
jgi:2-C-methyl-D-erythritol 2,4-cyclodiphosphate synthase